MSLADDLQREVAQIFKARWDTRDGQKVPEAEELKLSNDGVRLDATVLYADMSGSTSLVDSHEDWFAAEIYKAYLHCAAKVIKDKGGVVTAYDGDRIMAIFIGDYKNSNAAEAALKINYARLNIINPAIKTAYPNRRFEVQHAIGIDCSKLLAARTGVRGANDLVWVGRAANYAAKLTDLPPSYAYVTETAYDRFNNTAKTGSDNRPMWERQTWAAMNNLVIYRSGWTWII
jgi:class 3 adenylate cyclase